MIHDIAGRAKIFQIQNKHFPFKTIFNLTKTLRIITIKLIGFSKQTQKKNENGFFLNLAFSNMVYHSF
jgi:hypothetical protein